MELAAVCIIDASVCMMRPRVSGEEMTSLIFCVDTCACT